MKKFNAFFIVIVIFMTPGFAQHITNTTIKSNNQLTHPFLGKDVVNTIYESFEGLFPPVGWTRYHPLNSGQWGQVEVGNEFFPGYTVTPTPNTPCGYQMAGVWVTASYPISDRWLMTPQISVSANYNLFFYVRKIIPYPEFLDIRVSTTTNEYTAFNDTLEALHWLAADSGWDAKTYSLAAYAGQNIYIAFREHASDTEYQGAFLSLDLVQVGPNAGIPEYYHSPVIQMFPNPANRLLNIKACNIIRRVIITNTLGQLICDTKAGDFTTQIYTSEFQPGLYNVTVETDEGRCSGNISIMP